MEDFEKLGAFYLGREYDLATEELGRLLLYDSKDLVTHAVCVGMTGSGKTGLCVGLLEEAAIDSVPSVIDPKGDLTNLLLTFPQLRGDDFRPGSTRTTRARKAYPRPILPRAGRMWEKGLGEWGQNGERIQKLRDAADLRVYTPEAMPVCRYHSQILRRPPEVRDDAELLRERIGTTVTSLFGLVGLPADPIQSRDHILLSSSSTAPGGRGRISIWRASFIKSKLLPWPRSGCSMWNRFSRQRNGLPWLCN